jgi:cobalamin biosynthesis protein CobT
MRVPKEKVEKARELRFAGKTVAETAKLTGLSRNTVAKLEKGWVDSKGVLHGGWANELTVERLRDTAKRLRSAEAVLDRNECARIAAGLAQELLGKIVEFLPRMQLKSSRDAKFIASEVRELLKLLELYRTSPGSETPEGVKQVVTLEDIKAHYERTRDITPSYIEPAADPEAIPGAPPEAVDRRAGRKRALADRAAEEEEGEESDEDRDDDAPEEDEDDEERDDEEDSEEDSE